MPTETERGHTAATTNVTAIRRPDVTLDDKYSKVDGRIYLSGIQALVRLPMMQRLRDAAAGLNTAGFVSGYRGSPLGMLDEALWKAQKHLDAHHVKFVPGVNEDLAATAVWGTQTVVSKNGQNNPSQISCHSPFG